MIAKRIFLPLAAIVLPLQAEPLPAGSHVDFLVVPAGPVRLAEFEVDTTTAKAAPPAERGAPPRTPPGEGPGGNGSGVKVKEVDSSEMPPTSVLIRRSGGGFYQIPCSLNAIGVPVRTPVSNTEIEFMSGSAVLGDAPASLGKHTLHARAKCVLVLLTKPLGEKRWTKPAVTMIPIPGPATASVLVANASSAASCGVVFGREQKILLPPLKHCTWKPSGPSRIAIAMAGPDGGFQAPIFDEYLKLEAEATTLIIPYEVTPQESFRRGKYSRGMVANGDFRPAQVVGENTP